MMTVSHEISNGVETLATLCGFWSERDACRSAVTIERWALEREQPLRAEEGAR